MLHVQGNKYSSPDNISESLQRAESAKKPSFLSGGTDLLVQLHQGLIEPDTIINVKNIPELNKLVLDENGLCVGAAISCRTFSESVNIGLTYPGLSEASRLIGSMQIQNRATIGGNICNGSPAADTLAPLIVNEAVCRIHSAQGERVVAVESFVEAPGQTVLARDELLVDIRMPQNKIGTADAYLRLIPRSEMDIAVAGAAVKLCLDREGICTWAKIAISAVAPKPLVVTDASEFIVGTRLEDKALARMQEVVRAKADPITDKRGTREYRLHVIGILVKRAALIAYERAKGTL